MSKADGWIGVDFDGTLAYNEPGQPINVLGDPILPMVRRVREWLAQGIEVRIVTARAAPGLTRQDIAMQGIDAWCLKHIGHVLPITCSKDFMMIELWDDRAVQVVPNTGQRVDCKADFVRPNTFLDQREYKDRRITKTVFMDVIYVIRSGEGRVKISRDNIFDRRKENLGREARK